MVDSFLLVTRIPSSNEGPLFPARSVMSEGSYRSADFLDADLRARNGIIENALALAWQYTNIIESPLSAKSYVTDNTSVTYTFYKNQGYIYLLATLNEDLGVRGADGDGTIKKGGLYKVCYYFNRK